MLFRIFGFACLMVIVEFSPAQAQSEFREWYANAGGFSVLAELVDVRGDQVQLKRKDGKVLWVDLNKLSLADVRYVKETLKKEREGAKKLGASPESQPDAKPAPTSTPPTSGDQRTASNPSDNKGVPKPMEEKAPSGSRKSSPFFGMKDVSLVLENINPTDIIVPDQPSTYIGMRKHAGGYSYSVANIRTGKITGPFSAEGHITSSAISSDGSLLAFAEGMGKKVVVYSTATGKRSKDLAVTELLAIQKMSLIGNQRLFLIGMGHKDCGVMFDLKSGKPLFSVPRSEIHAGSKHAISSHGEWIAFQGMSGNLLILDSKSGKRIAELTMELKSGKGLARPEVFAFCNDDEELAVLTSGAVAEFQVYSFKEKKWTVKHSLSGSLQSLCPGHYSFVGKPIEALYGNQGWILFGSAIVDREKGGPVWIDKDAFASRSVFRAIVDQDRFISLSGSHSSYRFELKSIPWKDIAQSKEIVAKGGTIDDQGLPPVTEVEFEKAPFLEDPLNPKLVSGEKKPPISSPPSKAFPIEAASGLGGQFLFSSKDHDQCLVVPIAAFTGKKMFSILDLNTGKVTQTFPTEFASIVYEVSSDGRWVLSSTGQQNDRLDVFDLQSGKHHIGFRLSPSTNRRIFSVKFLSKDRFISSTADGESIVWELPNLKALYRFRSLGGVFPFPSEERFLYRNSKNWIVRKTSDGEFLGTLESNESNPSEFGTSLSIQNDDSKCAAILGNGSKQRLIVWDLLNGRQQCQFDLSSVASIPAGNQESFTSSRNSNQESRTPEVQSLHWCDGTRVLIRWDRNDAAKFARPNDVSSITYSLLDYTAERILWNFRLPNGPAIQRRHQGQIWFAETTKNATAIVGVEVPTQGANKQIEEKRSYQSLLKSGDSVVLEIDVKISGDKLADSLFRDQIATALADNFKKSDIKVTERAPLKLTLSVNQTSEFGSHRSGTKFKLLTAGRLTDVSNQVLWEKSKVIDHQSADETTIVLAEDIRKKNWENALLWLKESIQPSVMYERWYYQGLGESILSSKGETLVSAPK